MKLSIIICTFNRAIQLEQLLEDLSYQYARLNEEDRISLELILIDNSSFDNTKEIAYRYTESTILPVRYYLESKRGLANAKNLGIKQSSGDLLAFLDDDMVLDEDWMKESMKLAKHCKEREIGVYGGRCIPLWQERVPQWLNSHPPYGVKQEVFASHSYGDEESFYPVSGDFGEARFPIGTNVFFRKDVFENCGDFRTDLGPDASGKATGLHEDYEFLEYLSCLKIPMLYVPQCIVFHPISHQQMTPQYIRRWYFKSGKSLYWMAHTDRMKRNPAKLFNIPTSYRMFFPEIIADLKVFGTPLYLWLKLFYTLVIWALVRLTFDRKKEFWFGLLFSRILGEIAGAKAVDKNVKSVKFSFKERLKKKQFL